MKLLIWQSTLSETTWRFRKDYLNFPYKELDVFQKELHLFPGEGSAVTGTVFSGSRKLMFININQGIGQMIFLRFGKKGLSL